MKRKKYEMIILLSEELNNNELKTWSLNFATELQKFDGIEISVISCGKKPLVYPILERIKGNLIVIKVSIFSENILVFQNKLKLDENVIRSYVLKQK